MKKILSVIIALIMTFSVCSLAFAGESDNVLKFNPDGKFKIIHLCDCQDTFPSHQEMFDFIYKVIEDYKPDLVVLGGDNTVGPEESKEQAVEELVKPFVETGTYFTMVFGNHDHQQGWSNPELFDLYVKYGGKYFLATNEVDVNDTAPHPKAGTHYLPVYSSKDSSKVAYGLYMFDSGNYVYDEDGNDLGYGCVEPYQIDWYRENREKYKDENGNYIPAMAFQHIIVGDVYDYLYYPSAIDLGELGRTFYGKHYTFVPKCQNFTGYLNEPPCPGYYNYGQLDAMAEKGEVKAIFSGHDHVNDFDVEIKGIHVINTPGITYHSYSSELNHGCRLITIDENTGDFETEVLTVNGFVLADEEYAKKIGVSTFTAAFYEFVGPVLLSLGKAFSVFGKLIDLFVK
jgi:predicted MPP superfamily phosphohydrolase